MKVLHVSTYDGHGGAGRAALALHTAMLDASVDSTMLVAQKDSTVPQVTQLVGHRKYLWRATQMADRKLWDFQNSENKTWRSPARFGVLNADVINESDADIVNLHWVTNGFLSIKQISRITKPIVWSLYDMWVFSGSEHYGDDSSSARWRAGYSKLNRATSEGGYDLDRATWARKKRFWSKPIHIVPASSWLFGLASESALVQSWPISRIAHVVDTNVFATVDRRIAREHYGLPTETPLVLFLAAAGIEDSRKGWELLEPAMTQVKLNVPKVEIVVAGPPTYGYTHPASIPIHWIGEVEGNDALRTLYATADVVAVPSKEDNMPLTAMEAQSVGTPVAAFSIGGLPDIVVDRETGILAPSFDIQALATGISDLLSAPSDSFGIAARQHAMATWAPNVVVEKYLEVYRQEISSRGMEGV